MRRGLNHGGAVTRPRWSRRQTPRPVRWTQFWTQTPREPKGKGGTKARPRSRYARCGVTDRDQSTPEGTPSEVFETAPYYRPPQALRDRSHRCAQRRSPAQHLRHYHSPGPYGRALPADHVPMISPPVTSCCEFSGISPIRFTMEDSAKLAAKLPKSASLAELQPAARPSLRKQCSAVDDCRCTDG